MTKTIPCPQCAKPLDDRDLLPGIAKYRCWACGKEFVEPQSSAVGFWDKLDGQVRFSSDNVIVPQSVVNQWEITWQDYRQSFNNYELIGEWVAQDRRGFASIRMPATVSDTANDTIKISHKQEALRKLVDLLKDSDE